MGGRGGGGGKELLCLKLVRIMNMDTFRAFLMFFVYN